MKLNKKKLEIIMHILMFIIMLLLIFLIFNNEERIYNQENIYVVMGCISIIIFVMVLVSYKKIRGNIMSAFFIYMCSLFIFSLGQSVLYIFFDSGLYMDVRSFAEKSLIVEAEKYSICSFILFYLGWLITQLFKNNSVHLNKKSYSNDIYIYNSLRIVGTSLFILSVIPAISELIKFISIALSSGYGETISIIENRSSVSSILGAFFNTSLIMLIIGNKNNKKYRNIWSFIFIIYASIYMILGDRGTGAPIILSLIWLYMFFFNKKLNVDTKKFIILLLVVGILLPIVSNSRQYLQGGNISYFNALKNVIIHQNLIVMMISEMGFSMFALTQVIRLMPSYIPLTYGKQYLDFFTNLIPSFIFQGKAGYQSLGEWLKQTLNMRWGPGFSLMAESYFNFGKFGMIVMVIEGILFALLMDHGSPKDISKRPLRTVIISLSIIKLIDSARRNITLFSFYIVYNMILPCILVIILSKILRKNVRNEVGR